MAARVDWPKGKIDLKESSVKKLKEIAVEASHKAQGVEVFFVGSRRVTKVYWSSIVVCAFVRRFPSENLGLLQGGPK